MFFKSRLVSGISTLMHSRCVLNQSKNAYRKAFIQHQPIRYFSKVQDILKFHRRTVLNYTIGCTFLVVGGSYASVPLYRMYCQATGKGGKAELLAAAERVENMKKVKERLITVQFNADTASTMAWNFKPEMDEIKVHVGETALAFYSAKNPLDVPVIGIATYNVVPFEAGQYFNKIQCFCFEEQQLNPGEQVDMPVFFYLDPEYAEDPLLEYVDQIVLSYMFFEAKDGHNLISPDFFKKITEVVTQ